MSDATERLNAALEGRYAIERELGEEIRQGKSRRVVTLLIGSLLFALGCGGTSSPPSPPGPRVDDNRTDPNAPLVLQPGELCSDHTGYVIATFEDAKLQAAIRAELSLGAQDLTCGLVSGLTELDASDFEIESLVGIQNLTSLTQLNSP